MYNIIIFILLIITTLFYIGIMSDKLSFVSTYLYYLICISPFIIYYLIIILIYIKNNFKKKYKDLISNEDNI